MAVAKRSLVVLLTALTVAPLASPAAKAASGDDVLARLQALEKQVATLKQENEAMRREKQLRGRDAALVRQNADAPPNAATGQRPTGRDAREAYAASIPFAVKAVAPPEPGLLKVWGEGGAVWSGGDPILSPYNHIDLDPSNGITGRNDFFGLRPKVGWEAAAGFDYRFAASPWHVNGQFRYGESRTSLTAVSAGFLSFATGSLTTANSAEATLSERRWLADLALGRDIIGNGADAMQLKFGIRTAEFRAMTSALNNQSITFRFNTPQTTNGITYSSFIDGFNTSAPQESTFLGTGPRVGVDGSVRFAGSWAFDYLGDMAVLFGTQKFQRTTNASQSLTPAGIGTVPAPTTTFDTSSRFSTVFNPDIQLGVSYWMTQAVKVSLSYRLDAYFNVITALDNQNDPTKLQRIDRYVHGPRVAVTAQF